MHRPAKSPDVQDAWFVLFPLRRCLLEGLFLADLPEYDGKDQILDSVVELNQFDGVFSHFLQNLF